MSLEDKSKIGLVTHTWPELSVVIHGYFLDIQGHVFEGFDQ